MSDQPVSADQWTAISGVGTTVLKSTDGVVKRVVIPGTYVGTVNLHDAGATDGTTSTSQIVSFGLPATGIPQSVELNARVRKGIVYQATGTPVITVIWD